jgi:hypothetical protein
VRTAARWISVIGHPFVMIGLLVALTGLRYTTSGETLRALALVGLLTIVPVALLMVRQVRSGAWGNADASKREERPVLFAVAIGALICLIVWEWWRGSGHLNRGAIACLAMLIVAAAVTRWLKLSLHLMFAVFVATILLMRWAVAGWLLVAFIPVLAWSRLALSRHRPAELVAGAVVGALGGLFVVL